MFATKIGKYRDETISLSHSVSRSISSICPFPLNFRIFSPFPLNFLIFSPFPLNFLIRCPFPHSLSVSSFPVHFLILCPFPYSLSISSQFPHFLLISSQPGCKAAATCAALTATILRPDKYGVSPGG